MIKKIIFTILSVLTLSFTSAITNNEIYFVNSNQLTLKQYLTTPIIEWNNSLDWLTLFKIYAQYIWETVDNNDYKQKNELFKSIYNWLYNKKLKIENCKWNYCKIYKKYDKSLKKEVNLAKLRYDSSYTANQDYNKYYTFLNILLDNIKNNDIKDQLKLENNYDAKICNYNISLWSYKLSLKNINKSEYKKYYLLGINTSNYFWNPWVKDGVDFVFINNENDLKQIWKQFFLREIKNYKIDKTEITKYKCKWEIYDYFPKCFPSSKVKQYVDTISFTGSDDDIVNNLIFDEYQTKIDIKFILLWIDKNNKVKVLSYYSNPYSIQKNISYKIMDNIVNICKRQNWEKLYLIEKKIDYIMKNLDKKYNCDFTKTKTEKKCIWDKANLAKYWKLLVWWYKQLNSLNNKYDIYKLYEMNLSDIKNKLKTIERKILIYNVLKFFTNEVQKRIHIELYKYIDITLLKK